MASLGVTDSDSDISLEDGSDEYQEERGTKLKEEDVLPAWKRILHLPFEPVWANALLYVAYVQIFLSIYNAGFKRYGEEETSLIPDEFPGLTYFTDVMYFIDITLIIFSENARGLFISPSRIRHPSWVIAMDLLSLIPAEKFIPKKYLFALSGRIFYVIQLNDCLKLGRILHTFYHYHNAVGSYKLYLRVLEYCLHTMLATMVGLAVTYNTVCWYSKCNDPLTIDDYIEFLYISVCRVTTRGFAEYPDNLLWMACFILIGYVYYVTILRMILSHVIIAMCAQYYHRYRFVQNLYLVKKILKDFNVSKHTSDKCLKFFENFWRKRGGYDSNPTCLSVLPLVLREEISLDGCWFTLKHSKLFRDMDLSFLRYVSKCILPKFLQPGEVIYDKESLKDKMVYVISGVVQVLSEEDDETPILSFSGGTCLGEMSLMLGYESKATVRCKTYCNLHVLHRKDFLKAIKAYPEQFTKLLHEFKNRLSEAQEFQNITEFVNSTRDVNDTSNRMTIMWLKSTLHRLMVKGGDTSSKHECQNIFLRREFNEQKFMNENFTATNLDLLVICERLELVTDTVFLKTSCPCILQPDSIILSTWDTLIMILTVNIAFMAPFFAFVQPNVPVWYNVCVYITTIFWWLDIYVEVSVAVKTADEIIATLRGIFIYRIGTLSFLVQLIAALPLEILSCILLPKISGQTRALLQLNRVIKIWTIYIAFQRWENKLNIKATFLRYFKYTCLAIYLIFVCSCGLYALNCFDFVCVEEISSKGPAMQLVWHALSVTQILTGVSMAIYHSNKLIYYPMYIGLTFISSLLYIIVYGSLSAVQALKGLTKVQVQGMVTDILRIINADGSEHLYADRIFNYVETQWVDNHGSKLLSSLSAFGNVPENIYAPIFEEINAKVITTVPLLQDLPEELISELSIRANDIILPPNEVICYAGEISHSFYIIQMGFCKIYSESYSNANETIAGPNDSISVIETCVGIPVVNTVVTVTHCRLVVISYSDLMRAMSKHHIYLTELKSNIAEIKTKLLLFVQWNCLYTHFTFSQHKEKNVSFHKFSYNLKLDSFEEYDYYIPFDRLDLLSFVRFFLLRYTILPEGKFLYKWEIIRCICAIASALLFPNNPLGTCTDCYSFFFLTFLDAMAWLDIFVRFHVCYYTEEGILVTHPLKTATYYLTHAFVTDLLAVFPMQFFLPTLGIQQKKLLSILQLNRVLQVYRYIGFMDYYNQKNLLPSKLLGIFKYYPLRLVICTTIGNLLINLGCVFGDNIKNPPDSPFTDGVRCRPDMWLVNSSFKKPLNQFKVILYGIYFVTTILTQSGMLGSTITADITAFFGTILAILGYISTLHIMSSVISCYTSQDNTLLAYQGSMMSVRNYMNTHKVNADLQRQLIAHHEYKWHRTRGKDIHSSICRFHHSLQQDILYDVYGKSLEESWIFTTDGTAFLRSMMLEVTHDVVLKNGYISAVNDVNRNLYILYRGKANAIAPDGTKLCTLLPGSMFGNLDDCEMTRQTLSFIAVGHVEILTIEGTRFHAILSNYPGPQRKYRLLTTFHTDYLEGLGGSDNITSNIKSKHGLTNPFAAITNHVFDPQCLFMKIWQLIILIFVCYIEVCFDLFQMAMATFGIGSILFQYVCDTLYIINYYIQTHTAFENDSGIIVTDLNLINKRTKQNKVFYWCNILSLIPFDLVAWGFSYNTFRVLYPILRLNRLIRFAYLIRYIRRQWEKLDINLFCMQFLFTILWSSFVLHLHTCFLIAISCTHTPNMHPEIVCGSISWTESLRMYVRYYFVTFSIFIHSSQCFSFPQSEILIMYTIYLMICFELVATLFLAEIYAALQMAFHRQERFTRYLETINTFMRQQQISRVLQEKIQNYFKLLWRYQKGTAFPTLLAEAPYYLREAILNNAFAYHINDHFIFAKCHVDFNRQVVACMRNTTYFRGDYIVNKGTINGCLYFVHTGAVTVLEEDNSLNETVVGYLTDGMSFGITQGLFPGNAHAYSFRALNVTVILSLNLSAWEHLMTFYPASHSVILRQYENYEDTYK